MNGKVSVNELLEISVAGIYKAGRPHAGRIQISERNPRRELQARMG